eukprot:TRINITY_DN1717_c0_g1_i5.p1 TRINITY_DN1717_c0_g1~~TRINITY_DN1717_c0_g1_i5.p1  ORF type:complete len:181 (+),score=34.55 TRINITY_DN1717_c0_g1_i5:148-690(+)
MPVKEGDTAPEFTLVSDDMTNVTLSSLQGHKVVLAFFTNAFSGDALGGPEFQLTSLKDISEKHSDIKVLGVSHDWPFQNKAFKDKLGIGYPLLSDPGRTVIERFVGTFDMGAFFDKVEIFQAGHPPMPAGNCGCVVVDEQVSGVQALSLGSGSGFGHARISCGPNGTCVAAHKQRMFNAF